MAKTALKKAIIHRQGGKSAMSKMTLPKKLSHTDADRIKEKAKEGGTYDPADAQRLEACQYLEGIQVSQASQDARVIHREQA